MQTFEKAQSYQEVVRTLNNSVTIAPSYMIVGGVRPGEGAVITKARVGAVDLWQLDPSNGRYESRMIETKQIIYSL